MTDRIVVLGAGYTGVMAANGLIRAGFNTTVVTPAPHFVERVRLHRVAAGHRKDARVPLATVLNPDTDIIIDAAERINPDRRTVQLTSGREVTYDQLVFAVGSGKVLEAGQRIHRVVNEEAAGRLRNALVQHPDEPITVVGAGLTGIETACAVATAGRRVEIISRTPFPNDPYHRALQRRLQTLGIAVRNGERDDIDPAAGIVIDTTGLQVPSLAADSGLPVDEQGKLFVDPDLRVPGYPEIVGAGDAVHIRGEEASHLRMSCAIALPMGAHAARMISQLRSNRPPVPFRHSYAIQCVDLGGSSGRVQFVTAKDKLLPIAFDSILGGLGKELVVRSTVITMRHSARKEIQRQFWFAALLFFAIYCWQMRRRGIIR